MSVDHLDALSDRVPRVERSPHVSQGLSVASPKAVEITRDALHVAADISLTGSGVYNTHLQITAKREETIEVHVHIFTNGTWTRIPATDMLE